MIKISPSILASDFANLESELSRIEKGGADYAHIDVMDGVFVPNITLGPCIVKAMRPTSKLVFDVHLMITKPERYVKDFAEAGADIITVHYEATDDPAAALKTIKELGCRAGIVIKPKTSPEAVRPLLPLCDMVLVMTVEPGFGGQSLIPSTLDSVRAIREMINESGREIDLEVDGGISPSNVHLVTEAGANVIVAGSAVFKSEDIPATIAALKA